MKLKQVIYGMTTYIPGVVKLHGLIRGNRTGGTDSARYSYSVWLRHLVLANKNGLKNFPRVIAELGPGDSLGSGLTALLCGVEKCYALDVCEFASVEQNLEVFEELIELLKNRENIPDEHEYPDVYPRLDDYHFPKQILSAQLLDATLQSDRIEKIRNSIKHIHHENSMIQFIVPWQNSPGIEKESVDFIFSQAVVEYIQELKSTYQSLASYLKPDGFMSNQIDFKSNGTAHQWDGHWAYSDFIWKLLRGKRHSIINRIPYSQHLQALAEVGLCVVYDQTVRKEPTIGRNQLAKRFRSLTEDDRRISSALIQAKKES